MPAKTDDLDTVQIESRAELRAWLTAHHATSPGVWLVTFKKAAGERHVGWDAIVEEALCVGWIDSKGLKVDAERTKLLLTPRNPRSPWSALNKRRVEKLIADGLMTPAGLARIEAAKANGDWAAYDDAESLAVPADLAAALTATPGSQTAYDAPTESKRKLLLAWVDTANRPETRAKRIATLATDLPAGRNPLDWRLKQVSHPPGDGST